MCFPALRTFVKREQTVPGSHRALPGTHGGGRGDRRTAPTAWTVPTSGSRVGKGVKVPAPLCTLHTALSRICRRADILIRALAEGGCIGMYSVYAVSLYHISSCIRCIAVSRDRQLGRGIVGCIARYSKSTVKVGVKNSR